MTGKYLDFGVSSSCGIGPLLLLFHGVTAMTLFTIKARIAGMLHSPPASLYRHHHRHRSSCLARAIFLMKSPSASASTIASPTPQ